MSVRPLGDVIVLRTPLPIADADRRRLVVITRRGDLRANVRATPSGGVGQINKSALVVDARSKCLPPPFGRVTILHSHDSRYRWTQQDWIGPDRRPRRAGRAGAGDGPQRREPRLVPGRRRDGARRSRRSRLARRGHGGRRQAVPAVRTDAGRGRVQPERDRRGRRRGPEPGRPQFDPGRGSGLAGDVRARSRNLRRGTARLRASARGRAPEYVHGERPGELCPVDR